MLRVRIHRVRRTGLHDATQIHHGHTVGQLAHRGEVVGDEQVAQAQPLAQFDKQFHDLCLDADVKCGHRLIEHQHRRADRQRAGDAHALALTAGELVRVAVEELGAQVHQPEQFLDSGRDVGLCHAVHLQRLGEQFSHRHARVQRRLGVLEHDLQVAAHAAHGLVAEGQQVRAIELHRARGRFGEAQDAATGGALTATALAHERERLAGMHGEADAAHRVQHTRPAAVGAHLELLHQIGHLQQRCPCVHLHPPASPPVTTLHATSLAPKWTSAGSS